MATPWVFSRWTTLSYYLLLAGALLYVTHLDWNAPQFFAD